MGLLIRGLSINLLFLFLLASPIFAQGQNIGGGCSGETSYSFEGVVCSLGYIIDQFTEYTPNILKPGGGAFEGAAISNYRNGTQYLAISILPVIILVYVIHLIGEATVGKTNLSPSDLLGSLFISVIFLFTSIYFLSFFITFINVIDQFIVVHMIGGSSSLFSTIINTMGAQSLQIGIFSGIVSIILYILLIIALFIFSLQFIIRFIMLWILILLFPIFVVISIYPPMRDLLPNAFSKIVQLLFIQPAFLIGISVFVVIVNNYSIGNLERLILGIIVLFSLSLVPQLLGGVINERIFSLSSKMKSII